MAQNGNCLLVDPGDDFHLIEQYLKNLKLEFILLTHGHFDHILALSEFAASNPNLKIYVNKQDEYLLENIDQQARLFGRKVAKIKTSFSYIKDADTISFSNEKIEVIETPGHTPGSVCYLLNNALFSGDTLFYGSIGRTDFPGGDDDKMQKSLIKLAKLDNGIAVYPGHGPTTTIAQEKLIGFLKSTIK